MLARHKSRSPIKGAAALKQNGRCISPELEPTLQRTLQSTLSDLERSGGFAGNVARQMLAAGDWIDREVEERKQTIGGMDNLWLLLSESIGHNPVRPSKVSLIQDTHNGTQVCSCTFVLRGKLSLDALQAVSLSRT